MTLIIVFFYVTVSSSPIREDRQNIFLYLYPFLSSVLSLQSLISLLSAPSSFLSPILLPPPPSQFLFAFTSFLLNSLPIPFIYPSLYSCSHIISIAEDTYFGVSPYPRSGALGSSWMWKELAVVICRYFTCPVVNENELISHLSNYWSYSSSKFLKVSPWCVEDACRPAYSILNC